MYFAIILIYVLKSCPSQLARIMAILQQQRQHQHGGVGGAAGGSSKLSPSHLGLSKQPMVVPLPHPGMGGPLSDLHAKTQGMYSGESCKQIVCGLDCIGQM